ncbi:hypothetical protein H2204_001367 [Knufia peltigerae]|nr:hypothetical protein H2204_001367 [Knufia peltigerae]
MLTSKNNPAITAYRVYHLGQSKLDNECRRQTPDLHRIVAHASIVDSVRRWSRDLAEPSETVLVDSSSEDEDSDPFEDCYEEEDNEYTAQGGDVAIFDCDIGDEDAHVIDATQQDLKAFGLDTTTSQTTTAPASPKRRPPPPPSTKYELQDQSFVSKQNRPVMIRETAVEVDEDD